MDAHPRHHPSGPSTGAPRSTSCRRTPALGRRGHYADRMVWVDKAREIADRLHPKGLLYSTYEQRLLSEIDHDRLPRHM